MQRRKRILLIALIVFHATLLFAQYDNTPKVGEQAPALTLQQWLKGEPVAELKIGQLYVVEFSATWCAPCRKAIPHLTELARQYVGRIKFISVYMEDNNIDDPTDLTYIKKVQYLVDALGDKIGFSVAVDVPQQISRKAWGVTGIPAAFAIDSQRKITWVGHPLDLDQVLHDITTKTFDPQKAIQRQTEFKECFSKIRETKNLTRMDSLIRTNPMLDWLYIEKFNMLAGEQDFEAYQLVRWLLGNVKNFDWGALAGSFYKIKKHDYGTELIILDKSIEAAETKIISSYFMYLKAETLAAMGDFKKAIDLCQEAILLKKAPWEDHLDFSIRENQLYIQGLVSYQYNLLLNDSPEKANAFMRSEVTKKPVQLTDRLLDPILKTSKPDYALAHELIDLSLNKEQTTMYRAYLLAFKSRIYALMNNFNRAIEWGQLAVAEYSKEGGNKGFAKKQLAKLEEYKERLKGG